MNIIVVGCGRVGSSLARLFSDNDNNVVVIDRDSASFEALGRAFNGRTLVGIGFDEKVLTEAGIDEVDVVAAVTDRDNTNLMICEVASKLFGVERVIARMFNPSSENVYAQLGFDYVCGTVLVAEEIFGKVISGNKSHVDTFGEYEILNFSLNLKPLKKDMVKVKDLESRHDVRVIAFIRKDGSASSIPSEDSVLYHGDSIMICIKNDLVPHYSRFML